MVEVVRVPVEDRGRRRAAEDALVAWVEVSGQPVDLVARVIVDKP